MLNGERRRVTVGRSAPRAHELRELDPSGRRRVLQDVNDAMEQLASTRGAIEALLLEPPPVPPLIDAVEAGRQLGMSPEWVRLHGRELDIEVYVTEGVYRYDPDKVLAVRERRRPAPETDPVMTDLKRKLLRQ